MIYSRVSVLKDYVQLDYEDDDDVEDEDDVSTEEEEEESHESESDEFEDALEKLDIKDDILPIAV